MKKIYYRAMALLLAVIVFFNGLISRPVDVQAAWIPPAIEIGKWVVVSVLSSVIGWGVGRELDAHFSQDKEGNIIITPEALEELKQDYMKEVESAASQIPGAYVRHTEIDVTETGNKDTEAHAFAMVQGSLPGMYEERIPSGMLTSHLYYTTLTSGFYVEGPRGSILAYNHNLVLADHEQHDFAGPAYNLSAVSRTTEASGQLYGGDIVVFESVETLDDYFVQFKEDPASVPMYPYNKDTVGGTDKEIKVWDPETNVEMSIFDVDIDLSKGLVITLDGKIYLNYEDKNGNGIADDHDPEIKETTSTVLYSNTESGWGSGTVELSDEWVNYDWLGFSYGSPSDGGYNGSSSSVFYVEVDELLEMGTCFISHYDKRYMQIGTVADDYKKLNMIRIGATGESSAHAPVVYVVKGFRASGSGGGSGGGGSPDMSETNEELHGIRGVLDDILKYCKKIYNQVIVGNVINAIDAIANVLDTLKNYLDEAVGDTAAIAELGEELVTKFPFSLPRDILLVVTLFEAEPVAPVWEIPFRADFGGPTGIKVDETFVVDFTDFQDAVDVLKWFLSLVWIFGLAMLTPKVLGIGGIGNNKGD